MASGRLWALSIGILLAGSESGAQRSAESLACVTLLDASDRHAVSGARVSLAGTTSGSGPVTTSNSTGRACLPARDSVALQIDAVGYLPINVAIGTSAALQVTMQQLPNGVMLPEWGSRQMVAALTQALHRPELARDSLATSAIATVLLAAQSAPLQTTLARDSTDLLVHAYVDLATDGTRYSEVRLRFTGLRSIVLGATTTRCGDACGREYDFAFAWAARAGSGWNPDFMALQDSTGTVVRVALDADVAEPVPDVVTAPQTSTVRGVVRSDKGVLLAGVEVYTPNGTASTVTDERGEYELAVPTPAEGALITTRRIGWSPAFRILARANTKPVEWSPVLRSLTVLATQFVRAAGIPDALRSPRYDDFLARRARGIGQFFMADEIWVASSLGDVLNRARGIRAKFSFGSNITSISVPSCPVGPLTSTVGVFVDRVDQTGFLSTGQTREANGRSSSAAESVLARYVTTAIVGMEIYIGRAQLPAEYGDPRYCAVIALWTR